MWLQKLFQIIDKSSIGHFIDKRLDLVKATDPKRIYVENIRSFFNISTPIAIVFCEMAVKQNLFKKRIGIECRNCGKLIVHFNTTTDLPNKITCDNCQLLENEKYEYDKNEINKLIFYQINN
ncbi:hypothetical protein [Tenacibaculum finnmarkense]|uniref:hypothetical protein n=1 Tax=Tenacibaculum finnmarkense TaxID=2781243 RepID=UPI001EFB3946|nr:hypothetical protein [Tenacibaculum finnmarkense]MCG8253188.1 hypothetical protein [Tenacibaculum finnmarkense genomovar finnmarkense]MCG8816691.1 hypothetical protein [Tenacibaculum finnmarkense]MCG8821700.1 hypothetical protein [Tenacibaculum finnmarkense]